MIRRDRVDGMMLAGAVGDALGANLEFWDRPTIHEFFNVEHPDYIEGDYPAGSITDDSQMALFTAEAMVRSARLGRPFDTEVEDAYHRWYLTQRDHEAASAERGLAANKAMWEERAPGVTCLAACEQLALGNVGTIELPLNDSKGSGSVMRVAPCAVSEHPAFYGAISAAVTHGHPTGIVAAAFTARILGDLLDAVPLYDAIMRIVTPDDNVDLDLWPDAPARMEAGVAETKDKLCHVVMAHKLGMPDTPCEAFGGGWVADECLAIAVHCALLADEGLHPLRALAESVAHGGDSDTTGAVCGNLLGAMYGHEWIPSRLLAGLVERQVVVDVTADLSAQFCPL